MKYFRFYSVRLEENRVETNLQFSTCRERANMTFLRVENRMSVPKESFMRRKEALYKNKLENLKLKNHYNTLSLTY